MIFVVLVVELVILIILLLAIIFRRIWIRVARRNEKKDKERISDIIIEYLKKFENETDIEAAIVKLDQTKLKKYTYKSNFLSVMELFDRRFSGGGWGTLKAAIMKKYLLPKAERFSKSHRWMDRNFAVRCFVLCPHPELKGDIIRLIDDPEFLVSSFAAVAALEIKSPEGVVKIIEQMSKSQGYSYSFYRDIFLQNKFTELFKWVEELAANSKDEVHLACLEVLSGAAIIIHEPFLHQDLASSDPKIRTAALKVFAHNPQIDSLEVLSQFLKDPDDKIRAMAVYGLEFFASPGVIEKLTRALSDSSWRVRLQAAESLKTMGRIGRKVLETQTSTGNQRAYEAAQYALTFNW